MSRLANIISVPLSTLVQEFPQKASIQLSRAWLEKLGYDIDTLETKVKPIIQAAPQVITATEIAKPQAETQAETQEEKDEREFQQLVEQEESALPISTLARRAAESIEKETVKESLTFDEKAAQMVTQSSGGYSSNEEWKNKDKEVLTPSESSASVTPTPSAKKAKWLK